MARTCIRPGCETDISDRQQPARLCMSCTLANKYDPAKLAAHLEVNRARRHGLLPHPRTLKCVDCGGTAMEYDHREYAKPLQVDAVCRTCNLRRGPAIDSAARDTSRIKGRRPSPYQQAA